MKRVVLVLLVAGCAGDDEPAKPDRASCERYRDHVVGLRMHGENSPAHREASRKALGNDFVADCMAKLSPAELDCAMAARDLDKLRTCASRR